jgi:hypothetical protein
MQGKRYMLQNTTMMLHHPSGVARGQASDINNEVAVLFDLGLTSSHLKTGCMPAPMCSKLVSSAVRPYHAPCAYNRRRSCCVCGTT